MTELINSQILVSGTLQSPLGILTPALSFKSCTFPLPTTYFWLGPSWQHPARLASPRKQQIPISEHVLFSKGEKVDFKGAG